MTYFNPDVSDFIKKISTIQSSREIARLLMAEKKTERLPRGVKIEIYQTTSHIEKEGGIVPENIKILGYRARSANTPFKLEEIENEVWEEVPNYHDYYKLVKRERKKAGGISLIHLGKGEKKITKIFRDAVAKKAKMLSKKTCDETTAYRLTKEKKGKKEILLYLGTRESLTFQSINKMATKQLRQAALEARKEELILELQTSRER